MYDHALAAAFAYCQYCRKVGYYSDIARTMGYIERLLKVIETEAEKPSPINTYATYVPPLKTTYMSNHPVGCTSTSE